MKIRNVTAADRFRAVCQRQGELIGMQEKDIAQYFGVTAATICAWLKSPEIISIGRFRKLCGLLKITDDEILEVIKG